MRRRLLLLLSLGAAALVAAVAVALAQQVGVEPEGRAAVASSSGDFGISNSRDGMPIFAASEIGPGGVARGTVEIADTGSVPVELTLSRHDLLDSPGLGGGLLSGALALTITDVTDPAHPASVYAGPLDSMPAQPAGRLEPGASRTYEFFATLPVGAGADQNAVQGASVSVAYAWTATEAPAKTAPVPESPIGPAPSPPSGQPPTPPSPAPALDLTVNKTAKSLKGGKLIVWAGCDRACAVLVKGRLKATAGKAHRGAKVHFGKPRRYRTGSQKLKIPVPAKLRKWLASAPGKRRLRAKLKFTASGQSGGSSALKRTLKLRPPPRQ